MKEHLLAIHEGLRSGRFANEAAVSQGIVLRILHALSWPAYDTDVVSPEYSVEGRRVDYALCHPRGKPIVFIEVKQVGQSNGADRQLFEYAFHRGVPMAILTDGQEWHFFLPGEQGDYGERRVYKLDILERDPDESVSRLQRYLDYRAVCSGEAIEAAKRDYRNIARERQIQAALPEAWVKLIGEGDELLLELIADKVESLCGYKPSPDTVVSFLSQKVQLKDMTLPPPKVHTKPPVLSQPPTVTRPLAKLGPSSFGFVLDGKEFSARSAHDVLVNILRQLDDRDPSFLERFAALPQHGRTRRYVARTREDLFPDRPDLALEHARQLRPGWWVGSNLSRQGVERVIRMACEVAGFRYGVDLRAHLG